MCLIVDDTDSKPINNRPLTPEELKLAGEVDNWMGGFMVIATLLVIAVVAVMFISSK
jgi:hypothetical protein